MSTKKLTIDIDISNLTLGDIENVMLKDEKDMTFAEQLDLLDKIVVSEGGARAVPVTEVQNVMNRVQEELAVIVNPMSDNGAEPESS